MPKYEDVIESKYLKWRLEVCRNVYVGLCYRLCELFSMEMTTFFGFDIHKGRLKFPRFREKKVKVVCQIS